jgi:hypothetical protein
MSGWGQNAKYSSRVDVFRFGLEIGHCSAHLAYRIWADCVEKVFAAVGTKFAEALAYMRQRNLAGHVITRLADHRDRQFSDQNAWIAHLKKLGLTDLSATSAA